jgi:ABC-type nickel/cobalt efflux system permease component RcnA
MKEKETYCYWRETALSFRFGEIGQGVTLILMSGVFAKLLYTPTRDKNVWVVWGGFSALIVLFLALIIHWRIRERNCYRGFHDYLVEHGHHYVGYVKEIRERTTKECYTGEDGRHHHSYDTDYSYVVAFTDDCGTEHFVEVHVPRPTKPKFTIKCRVCVCNYIPKDVSKQFKSAINYYPVVEMEHKLFFKCVADNFETAQGDTSKVPEWKR